MSTEAQRRAFGITANQLGASFIKAGRTDREAILISALAHSVYKQHDLSPATCEGCLDIAAWLTVPGYGGECHGPY